MVLGLNDKLVGVGSGFHARPQGFHPRPMRLYQPGSCLWAQSIRRPGALLIFLKKLVGFGLFGKVV
jgi:hypothetical protein